MGQALRIGRELHDVWLSRTPQGYVLHLGERRLVVALRERTEHLHELTVGEQTQPVLLAVHGDDIHVHLDGQAHVLTYTHSLERFAAQAQEQSEAVARAPMPGSVIATPVRPGQAVRRGDVLIVIESMKMETSISASLDGTVETLHVQLGQTFDRDALLVTLIPGEATA